MTEKPKLFYGWINVFLAFLSITTYGLFYSFSVFIEPLEAGLGSTRTAISGAYTMELAVYCSCAIPWGWFSDKYGPTKALWLAAFLIGGGASLCSLCTSIWHLYIFFGIMAAIGHGAIWVVPTATLNRWFLQRRGLAVGIAMCGLGFGLLVVPPVTALTMNVYGWRVTFIILGVTFFALNVVVGIFIRGKPADMGLRPLGETEGKTSIFKDTSVSIKDFSLGETLRARNFWMLYLAFLFCFAAEQMVLVHIVPFGTAKGISTIQGALGLSFLGVGTILGRVGIGALSDKIGRVPSLIISCCIEAGSIFFVLAVKGPLMLYIAMFLLGSVYGGTAVLCAVMLGDFFGLKNIGTIMGMWATSGVPAALLGPLMAGMIFDATESYFWAIIIAGILCIGAIMTAASIKPSQAHPSRQLA
ncbi:MAG: MFS transporter [Deltaproteobacteria bacterium]|nr:MFS transporter [Deltaproteobacteria bacterium]